ncbi:unnamed protein product [Brachionus calyciflorus]|uniref:EndoU domain-containing protein n=1 Tax=Brachionus calyciflorus TaxID=104777 RepID=A0A814EU76_9BILA|nr:unnamed protein product [Brachionus calyciflorus]
MSKSGPWVNEKLSNIAQLLWDVDDNRLTRNLHYKINLQRKIKGNLNKDSDGDGISDLEEMFSSMTISPLFEYLDVKTIMSRPTYRSKD